MHPDNVSPIDHIQHAAAKANEQGTILHSATYTPALLRIQGRAGVWCLTEEPGYNESSYRVAFIAYGDTEFGSATIRTMHYTDAVKALTDRTMRAMQDWQIDTDLIHQA